MNQDFVFVDGVDFQPEDLQRMEDDRARALAVRQALSTILETSVEPLPLQRQLEVTLQIVLTIPFLRIKNKGAIFLVDEADGSLHMTASHGLDPCILTACSRLPSGKCLCGRVAAEGRLLFSSHVDAHHEIQYEGMMPHGHYCVPILSRDKVLGVMVFYLEVGHLQDFGEESLLTGIAHIYANALERNGGAERLQCLPNQCQKAESE